MKQVFILLFWAFLFAGAAFAAEMSAPMVGYSMDPAARAVRLILGIPGATHYSDPVSFPEGVESAQIAPGHRWILTTRASGVSAWVPETGQEFSLEQAAGAVTFSASGTAALFYRASDRRAVVYAGLPSAPRVSAAMAVSSFEPAAFAVDDSGEFAVAADAAGGLRVVMRKHEATDLFLREARAGAAFGFFPRETALAVADSGIELIDGIATGAIATRQLASGAVSAGSARFAASGKGALLLASGDGAACYRVESRGNVRAVAAGQIVDALRWDVALLAGEAPRMVVSRSDGDEMFYLPTAPVAAEVEQ